MLSKLKISLLVRVDYVLFPDVYVASYAWLQRGNAMTQPASMRDP